MAFKVLHCLLVFFRCSFCLERAKTSALTRLRIFLAGIQAVLAGFQLPDHCSIRYSQVGQMALGNLYGEDGTRVDRLLRGQCQGNR